MRAKVWLIIESLIFRFMVSFQKPLFHSVLKYTQKSLILQLSMVLVFSEVI